tara:strand:+ start:7483 stop:9999 length:2517 start_codon:yes stop_codon:yes gene_type:complete
MEISFGILTGKSNIDTVIQSIVNQNIASYEIIVIGPESFKTSCANVTLISSNELEKKQWVTKKKNKVITQASGDIIVIMKDYVILQENWYQGLTEFSKNNDWDICMNALVNDTNTRCLDWVWEGNHKYGKGRNIDYNITDHEKMYVPGAIVIGKKHVLTQCKFNEQLIGLQKGSDIIWSREALPLFNYKFNPYSKCTLISPQGHRFKKCRRRCVCKKCIIFQYEETVHNYDPEKNNVILVGNGCNLLNYEYGPLIDKFDNVVRFNRFQLKNYESAMGTRTNTIFCNNTLLQKDVHRYTEHNDTSSILVYNVKSTDFKTRYNRFFNIKHDLWHGLQRKVKYSKKQFFSTGFAAIEFYLKVLDIRTITIANFDFQMKKNQIEYFNKKAKPTHDNHNFAHEKQLVEALIEQGRIVVLDTNTTSLQNDIKITRPINTKNDLVVTLYNHCDISWIDEFAKNYNFNKIIIDKKNEYLNVGRESGTIFKYIIDNYNNLPQVVFFCQEGLKDLNESHKRNHPWLAFDDYAKCNVNEIRGHIRKFNKENSSWIGCGDTYSFKNLDQFIKFINCKIKIHRYIRCNNFAIGRDILLMKSLQFYENIFFNTSLSKYSNPNEMSFTEAANLNIFANDHTFQRINDKENINRRTCKGADKFDINECIGYQIQFMSNEYILPYNHIIINNVFPDVIFQNILRAFENEQSFDKFGKYTGRFAKCIDNIEVLNYLNILKNILVSKHKSQLLRRNLSTDASCYKWYENLYCIDEIGYTIPKHCDITKDWKRKCISFIIYINGKGSSTTLYNASTSKNITCTPNSSLSFVPMENETIHAVETTLDVRHTLQLWLGKV